MEITGKIILELPERSGVSARSGAEWRMKSFVLETMEQYPKKMQFEIFGVDRINAMNIQVGETYTISFDIDAREYQGRWYNSIRAFRAAPATAAPAAAPVAEPYPGVAPQPAAQPAAAPQPAAPTATDDLPF
ncbi:MAG: DUF3127 domain-containing protein [Bacteroidaceae bacterium]|nr:DUF3127 domain-containing protein [Bacteroidaceae bacterium]